MIENDILRGFATPNSERNYAKAGDNRLVSSFPMEGDFMLQTLPKRMAARGLRASIQKGPTKRSAIVTAEDTETVIKLEAILNGHHFADLGQEPVDIFKEVPTEDFFDYQPHPLCPEDPIVGSFFNGLVDNLHATDSQVETEIAPFYLDRIPFSDRISPLISELDKRIVPFDQTGDEVKLARVFLQNVSDSLSPQLSRLEIAMVYYGSAEYNDPHNLDLDILLFAEKRTDERDRFVNKLGNLINSEWDKLLGRSVGANVNIITMDELEDVHIATDTKDLACIYQESNDINVRIGAFSACLTGYPLFTPSQEYLIDTQRTIWDFAERNPLIAGAIHKALQETLDIRKERAKEIAKISPENNEGLA